MLYIEPSETRALMRHTRKHYVISEKKNISRVTTVGNWVSNASRKQTFLIKLTQCVANMRWSPLMWLDLRQKLEPCKWNEQICGVQWRKVIGSHLTCFPPNVLRFSPKSSIMFELWNVHSFNVHDFIFKPSDTAPLGQIREGNQQNLILHFISKNVTFGGLVVAFRFLCVSCDSKS